MERRPLTPDHNALPERHSNTEEIRARRGKRSPCAGSGLFVEFGHLPYPLANLVQASVSDVPD